MNYILTVSEWRINDMATRTMAAYYFTNRNQTKMPVNFNSWTSDTYGYRHAFAQADYGIVNERIDVLERYSYAIRSAAARSTVLLQNTGNIFPLSGREKFTAILDKNATKISLGPNGCLDHACVNRTLAQR